MLFDYQSQYSSGISFFTKEIDNYFIDYIPGKLNQLIITFENADQPKKPRLDKMREAWGATFLTRKGFSVLGIKPKKVDWYRGADLHNFFRSHNFKIFISSFQQVILYGSSMGGFAALTFAEACPNAIVVAFNPQSTLHADLAPWETRYPEGTAQNWTGDFSDAYYGIKNAKKVYIAYDPLLDLDRKHVERLTGPNVTLFKMPLVGHIVMGWMGEAGILSTFLDDAFAGTLTESQCQQLARNRRKTARYYIVMGLRTRYTSVALACANKLLNFQHIPLHHQRDFKTLIFKHQLWKHILTDQWKNKLINLEKTILFNILKEASDHGFPNLALAICNYVIEQKKISWKILTLAAKCQHRLGNLSAGKKLAYQAIKESPSIGNCYRILARILHDMGDLLEAVKAATEGVHVDPNSPLGWKDLAKYYKELGQLQPALDSAKQAHNLVPYDKSVTVLIDSITKLIISEK